MYQNKQEDEKMHSLKRVLLIATSLLMFSPLLSSPIVSFLQLEEVSAVSENTADSLMSLGDTLNVEQADMTKQLLGAQDVTPENTIRIDGTTVNKYLNDGSTASTQVFSSAYIQGQDENYGVRVQIVTPQNITLVSPMTYQNAAITAGAKDVLVRVATVVEVTGEGALAGVYALLDKSGYTLKQEDIQVADKEIKVIQNIKKNVTINDYTINQMMTNIKIQVIQQINQTTNISNEQLNLIVINNLQQYNIDAELNNDLLQQLLEYAKSFSETDAAQTEETIKQLEISIIGSNWPEILATQEGNMTAQQALKLDQPDYSDPSVYHPIIPALLNTLNDRFSQGEDYITDIYSHTFIVETMLPQLSQVEKDALNYIRTVIYQVQASHDEARLLRGKEEGIQVRPIKQDWLRALNQAAQFRQDPALNEMVSRIAIATGHAPEVFSYSEWIQFDSRFMTSIRNFGGVNSGTVGHYEIDINTLEVYDAGALATGEPMAPTFDFSGIYGVAVENNAIQAPVPSVYEVPEETEFFDEDDEIVSVEELPEMGPEETQTESELSEEVPTESTEETSGESTESISTESTKESTEVPTEESSEVLTEPAVESSTEVPAEASNDKPQVDLPSFNSSWRDVLTASKNEVVMTTEDILKFERTDLSDSNIYHPIIAKFYDDFTTQVTNRRSVQELVSHTFVFEEITPEIKPEERAALNQLRWFAFQYFLNEFEDQREPAFDQHKIPYREELLRRLDAHETLIQDANMKEIYNLISQTTGYSMQAYATHNTLLELDEQVYQEFSFWFDQVSGEEYALFSYHFETGSVGTRGIGTENIKTVQPLDFKKLYNVSVQNNYQPSSSIQITTEAQQKLDEIKAAKEAEASSEEPVVEPEPEPESEPAVEEEWTPPPVILEPEPTPESTPVTEPESEPEFPEEEIPLVTDSE